jgi:hypothetical protein
MQTFKTVEFAVNTAKDQIRFLLPTDTVARGESNFYKGYRANRLIN